MDNKFQYTSNLKDKDIYIFVICNNLRKRITEIKEMLNIKDIPKKFFDNYSLNNSFE